MDQIGEFKGNTFWTVFRYLFGRFLITRLHLSLFFCARTAVSEKAEKRKKDSGIRFWNMRAVLLSSAPEEMKCWEIKANERASSGRAAR